jgi:pyrimidine-nucleoside phosphorylase
LHFLKRQKIVLVVDLIEKKQRGEELTPEEIRFLIHNFSNGHIPDYQVSAWLMSVFFQGMNTHETSELIRAMVDSGAVIDFPDLPGVAVDKHSTGGVGDKITFLVAPLVAAAGVPVPMISGRGLGHTGGTLDKLESIPGLKTAIDPVRFKQIVADVGLAIISQSDTLVPADRKLYSLRDVTATVKSLPLICSSILSKKVAEGARALVLDIKTGIGAVIQGYREARILGRALVEYGNTMGLRTVGVVTNMDTPLGNEVGNALEIAECAAILKSGTGPDDLIEITMALGSRMLVLGKKASSLEQAEAILKELLQSGKGFVKWQEMVVAQGGNPEALDNPDLLPQAKFHKEIKADRSGIVQAVDALQIGKSSVILGAGRRTIADVIDPGAGITVLAKPGAQIKAGDRLAILHTDRWDVLETVVSRAKSAFEIGDRPPDLRPYILDTIGHVDSAWDGLPFLGPNA